MGFIYIDESIHDKAGFIIVSFVYSKKDLSPMVNDALLSLGYLPGHDEFKSSSIKVNDESSQLLRGNLMSLIHHHAKVGLMVLPRSKRKEIGNESILGLDKIITNNKLSDIPHSIYYDEGISAYNNSESTDVLKNNQIFWNQNSKLIGGLQIADCVAHTLSIMLKEEMGLISKMITMGENSGYDPNEEFEIGFELWASLRYSIFGDYSRSIDAVEDDPVGSLIFDTWDYAVYASEYCDETLLKHTMNRFGTNYLGCIH